MLHYILYVGILVIVGLILFIATRPAAFRIERSGLVAAPAEIVFGIINDFRQWPRWSPWEKLDPNMKKTIEGPPAGVGASFAWAGNQKAGEGRSTILESTPNDQIVMKLEMFKPFPCENQVTFKLVPADAGTRVSWIMEGKNGFMVKAFSLVMNMDAMVGKDFEEGLVNLNREAQAGL
jgi:uncharacterized protein YndB with AHSA1/START domain